MTARVCSVGFTRLIAGFTVLVAVCALALALPVGAQAKTYYVSVVGNDLNDGSAVTPFATVKKALSVASSPGDVVSVGPGTFSGDATMTVAGVSLQGAGASMTILRGDGHNSVIYANGVGLDATISGFTITGGSTSGRGGGIDCYYASPTITGNTITGNNAGYGGGIGCYHSSPTITGNTIIGNNTTYDGGGIDCDNSSPAIQGNTIVQNSAKTTGGGIYCVISSSRITHNTVDHNSATAGGGGINCYISSPTIADNTIVGNTAGTNGGGVDCDNSSAPTISANSITANRAQNGGGIGCIGSSPTIAADTIAGNAGPGPGGGIYCVSSSPPITDDAIIANSSGGTGGGLYGNGSSPTITNSVIAGNVAAGGGDGIRCVNSSSPEITNDTITGNSAGNIVGSGIECDPSSSAGITNCILWHNSDDLVGCSATYSDISDGDTGTGNINADPSFVASASGDYHLSVGSPCIDDASPTVAPATDKDGIARPWGVGYDMGAYEYYVPTYHTATSLSAPKSIKVKKSLKLSGAVSPTAASPYAAPGKVTIAMTRKVGKKWKGAGSAKVGLVGGKFTYSFKPKHKGSWHFVATYSGGVVGPTTCLSSRSGVKGVTVK